MREDQSGKRVKTHMVELLGGTNVSSFSSMKNKGPFGEYAIPALPFKSTRPGKFSKCHEGSTYIGRGFISGLQCVNLISGLQTCGKVICTDELSSIIFSRSGPVNVWQTPEECLAQYGLTLYEFHYREGSLQIDAKLGLVSSTQCHHSLGTRGH